MALWRRQHAPVEHGALSAPAIPRRRDSDWGAHPRTHDDDISWAAKRAAVRMAAATLHAQDGSTGAHSDDVVHLCDAIADELGVYGAERAEMLAAAQLHDIGKVAIPQEVLEKRGRLDEEEWALIREHTVAGEQIIRSVPELWKVALLVRHSHERWDGGGYPDGLAGEEIPLGSRVVFCADAYHAVRSDRPYRKGRSARSTLTEIKRNAGSQFDPVVADALTKCAGETQRKVRSGARGLGATVRSRRLVALLLTLALGTSALAAGGSYVLRSDDSKGTDKGANSAESAAPSKNEVRSSAGKGSSDKRPAGGDRSPARPAGGDGSARGSDTARPSATTSPSGQERPTPRPSSRSGALAPSARPPATPRRPASPRRVGRPQSPGRSEEAPRRPAQPGRPLGGAPGRSEEAPGRPTAPIAPPAKPVTPPRGPRAGTPGQR